MTDERDREGRRKSDRAAKLSQEMRATLAEAKGIEQENPAKKLADETALKMLQELPSYDDLEADTTTRNMRDILTEEQIVELNRGFKQKIAASPPLPITKPPITRPTPEALRDSRREATEPPAYKTIPSPAPQMPIPDTAYESEPYSHPSTPQCAIILESSKRRDCQILIVDDSEDTVELLLDVLGRAGYKVCHACDGWDAVMALAKVGQVDLILLDLKMPRVNGAEFMEWLNKPLNPWHGTPVLVISGTRPHGLSSAAEDAFIFKPIKNDELLEAVRIAMEKR